MSTRKGFTLPELLVVIAIIALLMSFMYGAMWHAQNSARVARTRALIAKIHGQLMPRIESYETRRVPLFISPLGFSKEDSAKIRLLALRDMMRMELPQRYEDITTPPTNINGMQIPVPAVTVAYQNRLSGSQTPQYQSAECLYLIMTVGLGEEGLSSYELSNSEVGDLDQDGMLEFHDGWGKPIAFLRWAPGFLSEKQISDPINNHDPLDINLIDPKLIDPNNPQRRPFALVPLIYSAGPDGIYDIKSGGYMGNDPYGDPTVGAISDQPSDMGPANGEMNAMDNIHNHMLGIR